MSNEAEVRRKSTSASTSTLSSLDSKSKRGARKKASYKGFSTTLHLSVVVHSYGIELKGQVLPSSESV